MDVQNPASPTPSHRALPHRQCHCRCTAWALEAKRRLRACLAEGVGGGGWGEAGRGHSWPKQHPESSPRPPLTAAEGRAAAALLLDGGQLLSWPTCRGALGAAGRVADCGEAERRVLLGGLALPTQLVPNVTGFPMLEPKKYLSRGLTTQCGPSGFPSLVLPQGLGRPRSPASFLGENEAPRGCPSAGVQSGRRGLSGLGAAGPTGWWLCPAPSSWAPTRRPARQGSPHSVSWQHGLSARGLVTATKPAWPHSRGSSRASHCTGTHCTDTEPASHTQAWQLLTHRSPGCNRPGQGP